MARRLKPSTVVRHVFWCHTSTSGRVRSGYAGFGLWPTTNPAAGQDIDVRLTAPDGYHTERAYSIASPPEDTNQLELAIERLEGGEVSPYLVDDLAVGDELEFRGPIGDYFIWNVDIGGPLLLVAGGSGIAPLMAMVRHRAARRSRRSNAMRPDIQPGSTLPNYESIRS